MTREEWYRYIWNEVENYSELAVVAPRGAAANAQSLFAALVANPSAVNWLDLLVWTAACVAAGLDSLVSRHKTEQAEFIAQTRIHSEAYLETVAKAYRHNSATDLPWTFTEDPSTFAPIYGPDALEDSASLVIGQAVAKTLPEGTVLLAVAQGTPGNLTKVSDARMTGLRAYLAYFDMAGQFVDVVTGFADVLRTDLTVKYDPLRFTNEGAKEAVRAALRVYASTSSRGVANLQGITDAVQAIEGITDVRQDLVMAKVDGGVYAPFAWQYAAVAGYLAFDETSTLEALPS